MTINAIKIILYIVIYIFIWKRLRGIYIVCGRYFWLWGFLFL